MPATCSKWVDQRQWKICHTAEFLTTAQYHLHVKVSKDPRWLLTSDTTHTPLIDTWGLIETGGAYNLPTTYDRILVTCSSSSASRDHKPDEVRRWSWRTKRRIYCHLGIFLRVWLSYINVLSQISNCLNEYWTMNNLNNTYRQRRQLVRKSAQVITHDFLSGFILRMLLTLSL